MTRFDRLLDSDATDVERMLLDSASDDAPSARARRRTLAAMGVGGAVLAGAQGAAAAKLAAAGAAAPGAKSVGSVSALLVLKWLGTGAVVGSVVAASVATVTTPGLVFSRRATPAAPASTAPQAEAAGKAAPRAERASAPRVEPERAPSEIAPGAAKSVPAAAFPKSDRPSPSAPNAPSPGDAVSSLSTLSMEPKPAASTVTAEVASLDRARAALAAGDARAALARIAAHDESFPGGALQPEAVVLRVRALIALGDRAQAASVTNAFLAAHPDSAQAGRLRALVGGR